MGESRRLSAEHPGMRYDTKKRLREQADRVAWRILLDWTKAQLTMINLEQVKPEQAFLPYAYDPSTRQTLFEKLEQRNFMMLGAGEDENDDIPAVFKEQP